jgi:2-oxoglutarate ferredoxin oxidoreductase subunit alpha
MALGLSYAGARVACGTSGGGFCYMTEAVGLSGVAELPLVIFEAQRPGPALGMPTWTAQADLLFVINASQDEFPRIVLAPGDVPEAFDQAKLAFSLAEDYQLPVIVLSDKHLSESNQSTHFPTTVFSHRQTSLASTVAPDDSGFYPRYQVTSTGISPRSIPGQSGGYYLANSYEHDLHGLGSELSEDRVSQMDKRFAKVSNIRDHIPQQFYTGPTDADITFISWGSTKGAIRQALPLLEAEGINAAMLNLSWLWPFPAVQVDQILQTAKNPVIIEGNKTYQLSQLIRQVTGHEIYHKRQKYDGRPFYPHELVSWAHEILK